MEYCRRCRKRVEMGGSLGFALHGDSGFLICQFYAQIKTRYEKILAMQNSFEQAVAKKELYDYCNAFNRYWCKLALKTAEEVQV